MADLARHIQGQRVNLPDQGGAKGRMYRTVAGKAIHRGELRRTNDHTKMALPAFGIAGMPPVLFTFVNDFNVLWLKRRHQCGFDLVRSAHNFTCCPPSILGQTV